SPLSTLPTDTFRVMNSKGVRAEFTGIRVRYDPEGVAKSNLLGAFVELEPGESFTVGHNLAGAYNLSLTGAGVYIVEAANLFRIVEADSTLTDLYADLVPAQVIVKDKLAFFGNKTIGPTTSRMSKRTSYTGCSPSQQDQVTSAITVAQAYARESHTHLELNPSGSTRYTRWFGTFATNRYNDVLKSFSLLAKSPSEWTYDCTCQDPKIYAYVNPRNYGTVYLCGYFWAALPAGAGSKADTIIHEGTHFNQILGTADYAYGQRECLNLARTNPANAVYNADNHAFFS
ncbi:hypothetical protein B0J17DRAFT_553604, partial [Rhizoctonia solani]